VCAFYSDCQRFLISENWLYCRFRPLETITETFYYDTLTCGAERSESPLFDGGENWPM